MLNILLDKVEHRSAKITLENVNVCKGEAEALHVEEALDGELAAGELGVVGADLNLGLAEGFLIDGFYEFEMIYDGVFEAK